ncbi:hypothetical protein HDV01_006589 [Terramyces sp. JEL0728]|nr:hypothetical protein HDV01_006589 [Terramyces sp. JEL0728]
MPYTQSQAEYIAEALCNLQLKSLDIKETPCGISSLLITNELNLTNLESLAFGSRMFIQDLTCRSLFQHLQHLSYLEFSSNVALSELALVNILCRTKHLKTLLLPTQSVSAQLQMISSSTLFKIPLLLKSLEIFHAVGYPFNSNVLMEFGLQARNLKVLNIRNPINHSPEITIETLKMLIEGCPNLVELQIKGSKIPIKKLAWLRKSYWSVLII